MRRRGVAHRTGQPTPPGPVGSWRAPTGPAGWGQARLRVGSEIVIPPDPLAALLGVDEDLAEGGMVTGGEVGHAGHDVAVEGIAAAGDAEAFEGGMWR
jgi:hypothetical protein